MTMVNQLMKICCVLCALFSVCVALPSGQSGVLTVRDLPLLVEELQTLNVVRELIRQQTGSVQPIPKEICPVRDIEVYLGDGWEKWAELKGPDMSKALAMCQSGAMNRSARNPEFMLTDPDTWTMSQWLLCGAMLGCLDTDLLEGQRAPLVVKLKLAKDSVERVQAILNDIYLSKDYLLYGCISFDSTYYNGLNCKEFVFEGEKFCARLKAEYRQCKSTWDENSLPSEFETEFYKALEKWQKTNVSCVLSVVDDSLYIFLTTQPHKNVKLPEKAWVKSLSASAEREYVKLELSASLSEGLFRIYLDSLQESWQLWKSGIEKSLKIADVSQLEERRQKLDNMEQALQKWLDSFRVSKRVSPFTLRCWQKNGLHVECNLEGMAKLFSGLTTPAIVVTERNERDLFSVSGSVDSGFRLFYRELVPNFVALTTESLLADESVETESLRVYHQMFGAMIQNLWMAWEHLSQATSEDYELVISQAKQGKNHLQWRLSYVLNHRQRLSEAWQFFDSALRPIVPMMLPGAENGLDYHSQNRQGARVFYSELKDLPFEMPYLTLTDNLWVLENGEDNSWSLPLLKRHEKFLFYLDWNVRGCCDYVLSQRSLLAPMWYGYLRLLRNDVSRVKVSLSNEMKNTGVLRIFVAPVYK